ncbi:hypothetical protein MTR67_022959 [Solanum verrucosum]|uniref:Uncharacterized protein n=1 Tax=Solanum verrucosum TaxID=315347 RepID=A0AAF0TRR8_SOLVR|nr:hypothetical protein MTR67_022959 [Solanum verrucosum]
MDGKEDMKARYLIFSPPIQFQPKADCSRSTSSSTMSTRCTNTPPTRGRGQCHDLYGCHQGIHGGPRGGREVTPVESSLVVRVSVDVFPTDLPGLPLERDMDCPIELELGTWFSNPPYQMAP